MIEYANNLSFITMITVTTETMVLGNDETHGRECNATGPNINEGMNSKIAIQCYTIDL